VAERELHQLADVGELLLHAADVVVPDVVLRLLVLALHWLALAVDHSIRRHNAVLVRVCLHHLELDGTHATTHEEEVVLADGAVGLHKVRLEEDVEEVAGDALNRVVDGENVHALAVLDVRALVDGDDVTKPHLEVLADALVHADLPRVARVVREHNAHRVLTPFALDQHCVATEKLQLLHRCEVEGDHRVVIVRRLIHHEAVGVLLLHGFGFC